ncbi:MAG: TIGR03960 family B12-binding radical SAM protein [Anaerolineae bacterium]|nr:TIGR03960 family B12-binding radical SAM protein [Anaerolineae bacterium]
MLHRVIKPGRYVGGEYNAVHKPWDSVDMHICLAFPDIYDLGMSNFALTILYDILNTRPDTVAERTYLPAPDMIDQMRAVDMPLYTLESYRPVAAFDILAISTAYEQLFTNSLELLDLAGLPIHSTERTHHHPLVIGGGHGTFNAEPITDFFDAFVIGEGEAVIMDIVEALRQTREQPREVQLRALVDIPGIYVPRFYQVNYTQAWTVADVTPTIPAAPATIKKRLLPNLPPTPIHQIVPNIEIVHDRATIEIHRGCTRGCRFCQAGTITRPVRERPAAEIEASIVAVIEATGYEEVAPLSLSSADHSEIQEILTRLLKRFEGQHISISLPSLRIESVSVDLADMLTQGRRSGFTIAPEAATDRLRNRINKSISTEQILQVAEEIFTRGWRTLKLYFMLGLPGETDEDIEAIADIAHQVKHIAREKQGRKAEVHVSVSTFVPKPHTVFQWEPLADEETVEQRQGYLKRRVRGRGLQLMWNSYSDTLLEALLARGDRRLNAVVERAWQLGARFDAWQDWHNDAAWQQAFTENAVDLDFYLHRQRSEDEVFPWDHLHSGVEKTFLLQDYRRSLEGELLSDCRERCHACGILTNYPGMHTEEWQCLKKH